MTNARDGTARIDSIARRRGLASVDQVHCVSLGRTMIGGDTIRRDGLPAFAQQAFRQRHRGLDILSEHIELDCHGTTNTHIDGLGHMIASEGVMEEEPTPTADSDSSILAWAEAGLVTRGILVDIPELRGTSWVEADAPVTGEDLERALDTHGIGLAPGDALLVYTGRDRYEQAGHPYPPGDVVTGGRPGLGDSAAEWISHTETSVLCWDMLDAIVPGGTYMPVHRLASDIGLALVDNCDLASAAEAVRKFDKVHGMLIVSPLKIPGVTGCPVNPLFIL